ncbi:DUF2723 domain-containing protein [Pedobacter sp. HMF7647]|uniref:DUF2723 domain-containing protein n=1 Tax=Hufsiella arboris TaxID=2695275 RepID=A0A7K1Y4S3_9SPHI|nr:DUF2723 domain-containing protein [Hufsiella arboris]MXV49371.1 DUF2723 domain-containing protein [Hufsiella arboris]
MKKFNLFNNAGGFVLLLFAFIVYFKTMQQSVSFWDCGEFISAAYRQQVGHQPGAPLFIMIAKMFSLLASNPNMVAFWVNLSAVMASAATIMFLFWTITALALKYFKSKSSELSNEQFVLILAAGTIGAVAYTFSDSFWFSAVEAEVYALSALFTAITFWAALKWDATAENPTSNKWLVFIAFMVGLSIGVHLLSLLAIPTIVLLIYFKKYQKITFKGVALALLIGVAILGFVQYGIIQYLVYFASRVDLLFVNDLGIGFGYGAGVFLIVVISGLVWGILYSIKKGKANLNLGLLCLSFLLLGYSSYTMILIRANAKTFVNVSNPDNMMSLFGYLSREQYADKPLIYGQYFDANPTSLENGAPTYRKGKEKYEISGHKFSRDYDHNSLLPRIYSDKPEHIAFYRSWLGLNENDKPTFNDNIRFLSNYQLGYMYWRYFFWNFAGRQDDNQGDGSNRFGNWLTGIKPVDAMHLGNQADLPQSIISNPGYNRLFALPLILGLFGLTFLLYKRRTDAWVTLTLFFFTGIAIILYLNQTPVEPRERDYAYAGSFYVFAIWIGFGVLAVEEFLRRASIKKASAILAPALCLVVPFIMGKEGWDDHNRSDQNVAHDMAINYLESCAPNAILFTNADNDTYPLWYAQSVEGVRTDVRVVCLQLLYNDSYINQMKTQVFKSAPLPITMPEEKYVEGVRDVMPYVDYGFKDSVELKDVLSVMLSDDNSDKVEMQDGSRENFLPTKKLRLTVDPLQVIKTGTISSAQKGHITDKVEWEYGKNYVSRADLAVFDILANNNWKRPIYFSKGVSPDSYAGLDNYLYTEGYAYRLLPLKREKGDTRQKEELANNSAMYDHLMNRFHVGSFAKAHSLDPESRRIANITWDNFNTLALNLYDAGSISQSKKVMEKAMQNLPLRNYDVTDTVNKYRAAYNFYKLDDTKTANNLLINATSFLANELNYYASLSPENQRSSVQDVQRIVSILEACKQLAVSNGQQNLANKVNGIYNKVSGRLIFSLEG